MPFSRGTAATPWGGVGSRLESLNRTGRPGSDERFM